jgi:hypothetical protein
MGFPLRRILHNQALFLANSKATGAISSGAIVELLYVLMSPIPGLERKRMIVATNSSKFKGFFIRLSASAFSFAFNSSAL